MKKTMFRTGKGSGFRSYFHGNRLTSGCSVWRVKRSKPAAVSKVSTGEEGEYGPGNE